MPKDQTYSEKSEPRPKGSQQDPYGPTDNSDQWPQIVRDAPVRGGGAERAKGQDHPEDPAK